MGPECSVPTRSWASGVSRGISGVILTSYRPDASQDISIVCQPDSYQIANYNVQPAIAIQISATHTGKYYRNTSDWDSKIKFTFKRVYCLCWIGRIDIKM